MKKKLAEENKSKNIKTGKLKKEEKSVTMCFKSYSNSQFTLQMAIVLQFSNFSRLQVNKRFEQNLPNKSRNR